MEKVELFCVGELKFHGLKQLQEKYLHRINYFINFQIQTLAEIKSPKESLVKKKEGELILKKLKKDDYVIALDQKGKKMTSVAFANFLQNQLLYSAERIVFVIGGYSGLSEILDPRIDFKLSFSDMTFAHDIFRIVFLEQLYRSFTIIKNMKYHR